MIARLLTKISSLKYIFCLLLSIGALMVFQSAKQPVSAASLTAVTAVPWSSDVSVTGKYTVYFTTGSLTPNTAKIIITFPAGFNISAANFISWSGFDGNNSLTIQDQTITINRDGTGTNSAIGAKYLVLNGIQNHSSSASSYTISVETRSNLDANIDGPTSSNTFSITPLNDGLATSAPWPTKTHDNRNTFHSTLQGPSYPTLAWNLNTNNLTIATQNVV